MKLLEELQVIFNALEFSSSKHKKQKRNDPGKTPYINHPIQVASILCNFGDVAAPDILIAAILHDTIEDTETSPLEIEKKFGNAVLSIVMEVTDDKTLPKEVRKKLQIEKAPYKSAEAKQVKLADKISNIMDLSQALWPKDRKLQYLNWSKKVVNGLTGANPKLEKLFQQIWEKTKDNL